MSLLDDLGGTPGPRRRRSPGVWLVLAMLLLLGAAGYVALHEYADGRVPLGTSVGGVGIGGRTAVHAGTLLHDRLDHTLAEPLVLRYDGEEYPFDADAAGVRIDVPATLADVGATADRWSLAALWDFLTGGRSNEPALAVDEQRFAAAVSRLTASIGRPVREGGIDFVDGEARPAFGRSGLSVDSGRVRELVLDLLFDRHPAQLPITERDPYVSPQAVRDALRTFAEPAMADDVVLRIGGHRVVAPPRLFGVALAMVPERGRLTPLVDGDRLVEALRPVMRTIGPEPRDASVEIRHGRPHVVRAVHGVSFDTAALAAKFRRALVRPPGDRVVRLHAAVVDPDRSTREARRLHVTERVAEVTVPGDTVLVRRLDGALLEPGESLSLSDRIGHTSTPIASALFGAALRAGLPIPSYDPLTTYDATLPTGEQMSDVEISAADAGVLVTARSEAGQVTVTLWSAPGPAPRLRTEEPRDVVPAGTVEDSPEDAGDAEDAGDCVPKAPVDGFTVRVLRRVHGDRDVFTSTYAPVAGRSCVPSADGPSVQPRPTGAASKGSAAR